MSLIEPRSLLVAYLPRYNEFQHHRHDVRPVLTGYALRQKRCMHPEEGEFLRSSKDG